MLLGIFFQRVGKRQANAKRLCRGVNRHKNTDRLAKLQHLGKYDTGSTLRVNKQNKKLRFITHAERLNHRRRISSIRSDLKRAFKL